MRARKTLLLLNDVQAAVACGREVLVFKPSNDIRFAADEVRSRAGGCHPAIAIPVDHPEQALDVIRQNKQPVELVAFDEAQFFNRRIGKVVLTIAENRIPVVFSGLNLNYRGQPFEAMKELTPLAKITYVEAKCMFPVNGDGRLCYADAEFTQRLVNNEPDSWNSPTVIIEQPGMSITYEARCGKHWQVRDMPKSRLFR